MKELIKKEKNFKIWQLVYSEEVKKLSHLQK